MVEIVIDISTGGVSNVYMNGNPVKVLVIAGGNQYDVTTEPLTDDHRQRLLDHQEKQWLQLMVRHKRLADKLLEYEAEKQEKVRAVTEDMATITKELEQFGPLRFEFAKKSGSIEDRLAAIYYPNRLAEIDGPNCDKTN